MIPLLVPKLPNASKIKPYLDRIDSNRWYTNFGPLVQEFKERIETYLNESRGCKNLKVAFFNNGTMALEIALLALGRPHTYCIMPSWTFTATASAAIRAGMTPYFVDVNPITWQMTPQHVLDTLPFLEYEVGAVMPVSPFGSPVNLKSWELFQSTTQIPVLIDGAAGFASVELGSIPTMISLHATKIFGIGEGGIIVSNNQSLIHHIEELSCFGFSKDGTRESRFVGTNGKISEYVGAVGLAALDEWDDRRQRFIELSTMVHQLFNNLPQGRLQEGFLNDWIGATFNFEFMVPSVDSIMNTMEKKGIQTRQWWGHGCHRQTAFKHCPKNPLPETDSLAQSVVGLPFHEDMTHTDFEFIRDCITDLSFSFPNHINNKQGMNSESNINA
jgi:dTDP-4-amino-4,6-dideoxygalactose transaminase